MNLLVEVSHYLFQSSVNGLHVTPADTHHTPELPEDTHTDTERFYSEGGMCFSDRIFLQTSLGLYGGQAWKGDG